MTMWMLSISHYQPVALTSRVMKCLEKLEVSIIRPMVKPHSSTLTSSTGYTASSATDHRK